MAIPRTTALRCSRLACVWLALLLPAPVALAVPVVPAAPDYGWLFDEGSGGSATASHGTHDASLQNGAGWSTDTAFSYAGNHSLQLDGADDVAQVAGLNRAFEGETAFSISLWVNADVQDVDRAFFAGTTPDTSDTWGGRYDRAGWLNGNGSTTELIKFGLMIDGSNYQYESGAGLQTATWSHVLFVWESGQIPRLYVDGVLDTPSETNFPTTPGAALSDQPLFLIGDGAKASWDGAIDEVFVWTDALTGDNAEWLAANSGVGLPVPEPGTGTLLALGILGALAARARS